MFLRAMIKKVASPIPLTLTATALAITGCGAETPGSHAEQVDNLVCSGPGCTCGPTFGIGLIQGNLGSPFDNLEAVFPRAGGGLQHYYRDNNHFPFFIQSFPWYGPASFGSGDVGGVSLIQSNFGNLEVIATVGNQLVSYYRDQSSLQWVEPTSVTTGVKGQPGFIQSNFGTQGHFEVVVPASGNGLRHLRRDNDALWYPWSTLATFGTGYSYEAVALIQSSYGGGKNFEVIARTGTTLHSFFRDAAGSWSGPWPMSDSAGQSITAKGSFDFVQSTWGNGTHKNFELVTPLPAGGLAHRFRDNTTGAWSVPAIIDPTGDYTAVGLIQSSLGIGGRLDYAARKNGEVVWGHRDDGVSLTWSPRYGFGAEPCCDATIKGEWSDPKGQWSDPFDPSVVGTHATLLPTGKVLYFGFADALGLTAESAVYNPTTISMESTSYGSLQDHPHVFCSGHTLTPDGRLWAAGGNLPDVNTSHTFNPANHTWENHGELGPSSESGRWYPTNAALPDGTIFTISGSFNGFPVEDDDPSTVNNTWQIFDPSDNSISAVIPVTPNPFSTDGFAAVDLYPFVYVVPSGAHAGKLMVHSRQTTRFLQVSTETWTGELETESEDTRTYPGQGTSVMLTLSPADSYQARVLAIGGAGPGELDTTTPATATVEMLDLGASPLDWKSVPPMNEPRVMPDSVLLPNGQIFVVGGSRTGGANLGTDPVLTPEIYDPDEETWTSMCPMRVPRIYHASALLLPDARVLTAGKDGVYNATPYNWDELRIEIYSPPYLSAGPRPSITTAPANVAYNAGFNVGWTGGSGMTLSKAVLISLGSVTHSFNMNQRGIELTISSQTSSSVSLTAPPDANVAPPGQYMLFLLSDLGVPSVAKILRIG